MHLGICLGAAIGVPVERPFRGLVGFSASTLSAGAFTYSQEWSGGKTLPKEHPQTASKSFSRQCLSAVIYRFPNPGEETQEKSHSINQKTHHTTYCMPPFLQVLVLFYLYLYFQLPRDIRSLSASVVVGIFDVGLFGCYLGSVRVWGVWCLWFSYDLG
jgi:hypothetical protein